MLQAFGRRIVFHAQRWLAPRVDRSAVQFRPRFESLGSRLALSGITDVDTVHAPTSDVEIPSGEVAAEVYVTPATTLGPGVLVPPTITLDARYSSPNTWVFFGAVTDDKPVGGLTVTFGGLLDGHSTTVNADGSFYITVQMPGSTHGTATAHTFDSDHQISNVAEKRI